MCRSIFSFAAILVFLSFGARAQGEDTSRINGTTTVKPDGRQLRFGIDISRPLMQAIFKDRYAYEVMADYSLPKDIYSVLEGGFGGSDIDYPDLRYKSSNFFLKAGIDKSMLQRLYPEDWDFLFVGVRYGVAFINRGAASFSTDDLVWGTTAGTIPAKSLTAHWAELTGGLRVELFPRMFAGYTVRARFLINAKQFRELPPAYIAGYGKGEKNTVFDFNFYLQYALRWK